MLECPNRPVNIRSRWEKIKNRGLTVFSYSILSQLIFQRPLPTFDTGKVSRSWFEKQVFAPSKWAKIAKNRQNLLKDIWQA